MWTKIKANPAAAMFVLGIIAMTFILKIPAVKASQFHDALEWLLGIMGTIAGIFLRALLGGDAVIVQKALQLPEDKS